MKKKYQEKWKNAHLKVKNARASRALRWALDLSQYLLALIAWLHFTTFTKSQKKFWAPLDQILDPLVHGKATEVRSSFCLNWVEILSLFPNWNWKSTTNLCNFSQIGLKPSDYFFVEDGDRIAVYNEHEWRSTRFKKYLHLSSLHVVSCFSQFKHDRVFYGVFTNLSM